MTRDDAVTIVAMIVHGWPGPPWEQERMAVYVEAILPLDAAITTHAVARARNALRYRPSIAELREFIQIERRLAASEEARLIEPEKPVKPEWVRRWERARAVGDMRPFPEQMTAMDALARYGPQEYKTYAPPEQPISDAEFWVQEHEYLDGEAPGFPAIVGGHES